MALRLPDVLGPALVGLDGIDRQPDTLDVALVELGLQPGDVAQLRRADGREVSGMGEQDGPAVADP